VTMAPLSGPLKPGSTAQLVATAHDADGQVLPNRKVVWATSDPRVATVADGLVSAREAGSAAISAMIEGHQGTVTVTVSNPSPSPAAVTAPVDKARATRDIGHLVDAFVEALNSRDMERVRQAYPGMSPDQASSWRAMLEQKNVVTKFQATLEGNGQPPTVSGDHAEAEIRIRLDFTANGLSNTKTQRYQAMFERDSVHWRLSQLVAR
jgi:hypothetical protein